MKLTVCNLSPQNTTHETGFICTYDVPDHLSGVLNLCTTSDTNRDTSACSDLDASFDPIGWTRCIQLAAHPWPGVTM